MPLHPGAITSQRRDHAQAPAPDASWRRSDHRLDGEPFRLIVDSGSPYLVVPLNDCDQQPPKLSAYGCADTGRFPPAAFAATEEQYGALPGRMQWLRGDVSYGETEALPRRTGRRVGGDLVFGGADRAVLSQSGGAWLGLIRQVN